MEIGNIRYYSLGKDGFIDEPFYEVSVPSPEGAVHPDSLRIWTASDGDSSDVAVGTRMAKELSQRPGIMLAEFVSELDRFVGQGLIQAIYEAYPQDESDSTPQPHEVTIDGARWVKG